MNTLLDYASHGKILDIGCAHGYFLKHMPPSFDCYGIDISSYAVEKAQEIHSTENIVLHDIKKGIPFPFEFDVITAFDVLEHFDDPGKVISSIYEKLKPGGLAYLELPVRPTLIDRDISHYYWGADVYRDMVERSGFEVAREKGYYTIGSRIIMLPRGGDFNYLQLILEKPR